MSCPYRGACSDRINIAKLARKNGIMNEPVSPPPEGFPALLEERGLSLPDNRLALLGRYLEGLMDMNRRVNLNVQVLNVRVLNRTQGS